MEFRQLKSFITVAEVLHFGRAAEALHLSQPALSKLIQALEDSLGIQLFERTKHWVKLTIAGQTFLETAHKILREIEEGIQITKQVAEGQIGQVRVGFTEATLFSLAPKPVKHYQDEYPQVKLILTSSGTEAHVEALRTHRIDVGFVYLPIREPSLSIYPLFEEQYVAALPTSHRLARYKQITLQGVAPTSPRKSRLGGQGSYSDRRSAVGCWQGRAVSRLWHHCRRAFRISVPSLWHPCVGC